MTAFAKVIGDNEGLSDNSRYFVVHIVLSGWLFALDAFFKRRNAVWEMAVGQFGLWSVACCTGERSVQLVKLCGALLRGNLMCCAV